MNGKLDAILKAFADYIRDHDSFDIVYSEKIGYVKLQVPHPDKEVPEVMDTPEILLAALFLEIVNDVVFSPDNPRHDSLTMTEYEETESRRRITAILETMEDGGTYHQEGDYLLPDLATPNKYSRRYLSILRIVVDRQA